MRMTDCFFHTSDHSGSIVRRLVAGMNCLTLSYYIVESTLFYLCVCVFFYYS